MKLMVLACIAIRSTHNVFVHLPAAGNCYLVALLGTCIVSCIVYAWGRGAGSNERTMQVGMHPCKAS